MTDKPVAAGKSSFDLIDKARFFSLLDPRPDERFVDLACGIGRYSLEIAKRIGNSGEVHAVDLWPEGIATLNKAIHEQNITNLATHVADITRSVPLDSGSFDTCLLAAVLHDLSQDWQDGVLREASRLLRSGGTVVVVEFKKTDDGPGPPGNIRISEQELEQKVVPHGLSMRHCGELGPYTYLCRFTKRHGT